ncbi:MAG: hypothetical protein WA208_04345 [Thermoanaerobaculia bacterium]
MRRDDENLTITARAFADVLLKVIGIRMLTHAALGLPIVLSSVSRFLRRPSIAELPDFGAAFIAPYVLSAVAGAALLRYAPAIAAWIAPDDTEAATSGDQTISLETIAFGVLGAYLLVLGLRDLGSSVYELATRPPTESRLLGYAAQQAPGRLVGATVQAFAGAALLLGRSGIARAWRTIRSGAQAE